MIKPAMLAFTILGLIAAATLEARQAAAPAATPAAAPSAVVAAELHQGIDVSWHSGSVDWATLAAAGHSFAFAKATEGDDLADPSFQANWQAMKAAGLVRGAYHFYVTEDDPVTQAKFFLATVELEPGDLVPVVDVETLGKGTNTQGLADRLRTFLEQVEQATGVKAIVYTSPGFWDQNLGPGFGDYPLWVAEYGVEAPKIPTGWQTWHLWQWQENAPVPGVQNSADLSKVNRSGPDLGALLVPAPAQAPATP